MTIVFDPPFPIATKYGARVWLPKKRPRNGTYVLRLKGRHGTETFDLLKIAFAKDPLKQCRKVVGLMANTGRRRFLADLDEAFVLIVIEKNIERDLHELLDHHRQRFNCLSPLNGGATKCFSPEALVLLRKYGQ